MRIFTLSLLLLLSIVSVELLRGQSAEALVYVDLSHGQRLWNSSMNPVPNVGLDDSARIEYINEELEGSLEPFNAQVSFLKEGIKYKSIKKGDLLILHVPSTRFGDDEVKGIQKYLDKGGNMLAVMEADYWTDNTKTNVNDILQPYNISFGSQSIDSLAGGYTKTGLLTPVPLKVTYQFGRSVEGGTPFAFNSQTDEPFGVFKQLKSGGKLIVLGDAMSTLYMTEWRGVKDYQCREFMGAIFSYLLGE